MPGNISSLQVFSILSPYPLFPPNQEGCVPSFYASCRASSPAPHYFCRKSGRGIDAQPPGLHEMFFIMYTRRHILANKKSPGRQTYFICLTGVLFKQLSLNSLFCIHWRKIGVWRSRYCPQTRINTGFISPSFSLSGTTKHPESPQNP